MKSKLFFLFIAAVFVLASCNDDPAKWRVKTKYRIHKVSFDGKEQSYGGKTDTFYFTPDGKPFYPGSSTTTKEERTGNIVELKIYNKSGGLTASTTTYLNDRGLEDSVVIRDSVNIAFLHKYLYDDNGYLIEDRQYQAEPPNLILKYKVLDGNRVEETIKNIPAVDTVIAPNPSTGKMEALITTYDDMIICKEFFMDKLKMPTLQNFGFTKRDPDSKNLEKSSVQLSPKGDTLDVYFFRYTFDEKGRVITAAQISRGGYEYDSVAYTYY